MMKKKLIIPGFYVPPKKENELDDEQMAAIMAENERLDAEFKQRQIEEQEYINRWFYEIV
jgi:hypothetical protein